jgi:signal transduction histidine kinase
VADPDGVAQIVRVLLDNALRFAPPGTAIVVELTSDAQSCVIAVHDRGTGVPEAEREQIFERFRRGTATGGEGIRTRPGDRTGAGPSHGWRRRPRG